MSPFDKLRLQVIETDAEAGRRLVGEVDLGADGLLAVVAAESGRRDFLERLVALVNAKPMLHVSVLPPADAPRYAMHSRGVTRSDAQFFPALQAFLARNYGLILSMGGPIAQAPLPATELPAQE